MQLVLTYGVDKNNETSEKPVKKVKSKQTKQESTDSESDNSSDNNSDIKPKKIVKTDKKVELSDSEKPKKKVKQTKKKNDKAQIEYYKSLLKKAEREKAEKE